MADESLDLEVVTNAPWVQRLNLKTKNNTTGVTSPRIVTGSDIRMQARRTATSTNALVDLSIGDGVRIIDGANGIIELYLSLEQCAALPAEWVGVHDIVIDDARLVKGTFRTDGGVTR